MYKVMRSFICTGCSNPVISTGHTSTDIGVSANLEVVDKFCYLGDILSVDGDADAAVEARIRTGWNKFRQLVPMLTNRDISLISRGRLYSSCVRSSMLHGTNDNKLISYQFKRGFFVGYVYKKWLGLLWANKETSKFSWTENSEL